jgi:hypothetical protein
MKMKDRLKIRQRQRGHREGYTEKRRGGSEGAERKIRKME